MPTKRDALPTRRAGARDLMRLRESDEDMHLRERIRGHRLLADMPDGCGRQRLRRARPLRCRRAHRSCGDARLPSWTPLRMRCRLEWTSVHGPRLPVTRGRRVRWRSRRMFAHAGRRELQMQVRVPWRELRGVPMPERLLGRWAVRVVGGGPRVPLRIWLRRRRLCDERGDGVACIFSGYRGRTTPARAVYRLRRQLPARLALGQPRWADRCLPPAAVGALGECCSRWEPVLGAHTESRRQDAAVNVFDGGMRNVRVRVQP